MARKIICDRCEKECAGGHGTLALLISHETRDGEVTGMDQFQQKDLCTSCADEIRTELNFVMIRNSGMGPDSMVTGYG